MNKRTLVIGVSLKPERYANKAIRRLVNNTIDVVALGLREGEVAGIPIQKVTTAEEINALELKDIHTVTLYLNAKRQEAYFDLILSLKPKRVIFNPGTENENLYKLLEEHKIDYEIACTLVLLSMNQY